jgi:hypothetical protein
MEKKDIASVSFEAYFFLPLIKLFVSQSLFFVIRTSYNKVEKDFPTLLEYNNYLEEVEDISKSLFRPCIIDKVKT